MSNFSDQHHDSTRATLFDAWYDVQPPKVQERVSIWLFVAADYYLTGSTTVDTAFDMARALLWAVANKDMKQFTSLLDNR